MSEQHYIVAAIKPWNTDAFHHLAGTVSSQTQIPGKFPADGRPTRDQKSSDLGLVMTGFHQCVNLVSLLLGNLRVDFHL